jgi:hypothetical protein
VTVVLPVSKGGRDGGRWYPDPYAGPGDERLFVSVTSVLSATTAKPYLTDWSAKLAAEFAVDNIDTLGVVLASGAGRDGAVDLVKSAARRLRDVAADRGSEVHRVAEALVLDAELPTVSEEAAPYVDAFLAFYAEHDPEFLFTEATVCSRLYGYAGTADGGAIFPRLGDRRLLLDVKTGRNVPDDVEEQLAAYRYADEVWGPFGYREPVPHVDGAAVLHLHPDATWDLVEVTADEAAFQRFRLALELHNTREAVGKRHRRALRCPGPDGVVPVHVEDAHQLARYRGRLAEHGLTTLAQLAGLTGAQLAALDGIGPKAVAAVEAALADHSLALQES